MSRIRWAAVWLRLRSSARHQFRNWLVLAVLLGVVAGGVGGAVSAARRTDTAYDRFAAATRGFDAILYAGCTGDPSCRSQDDVADRLAELDGVADAARVVEVTTDVFLPNGDAADPSGNPCYAGGGQILMLLAPDGRFGDDVSKAMIVEGRKPRGPGEVMIAEGLAERSGLGVGDVIVARPSMCADDSTDRPSVNLTIVGTQLSVGELRPERGLYVGAIHGDGALDAVFADLGYPRDNLAMVRTRPGANVDEVIRQASRAGIPVDLVARGTDVARGVQGGLDNDARTLLLLAVLFGVGAVALIGPVLARFARDAGSDSATLRWLGATNRELAMTGAGHGLAIGVASLPVIVAVQGFVSMFTPAGRAAKFEVDGGWQLDVNVLLVVAFASVLFSTTIIAVKSSLLGRGAVVSSPRITTAGRIAQWTRLTPAASTGFRMAFEPRHRSDRVPVRTGLIGIAIAVAAVVGVLIYRSSLDHLDRTPALAGWGWDDAIALEQPRGMNAAQIEAAMISLTQSARAMPGVVAASRATFDEQPVADGPAVACADDVAHIVTLMAFESGTGKIVPTVAAGRPPAGSDEVTLSAQLVDVLGAGIGDTVSLGRSCGPEQFTIVGVSVVPFGPDLDYIVATGAITLDGFKVLRPNYPGDQLLVQLDGTRSATEIADALRGDGHPVGEPLLDGHRIGAQELSGITLDDTTIVPLILAVMMALDGLAVVVYLVAVATATRRREIGTLRALGMRRRQVYATVFVHAVITLGAALAIALPVGLIAGRIAWRRSAERLGVLDQPAVPWPELAATVIAGFLLALVVATWPATRAANAPIAESLRTE